VSTPFWLIGMRVPSVARADHLGVRGRNRGADEFYGIVLAGALQARRSPMRRQPTAATAAAAVNFPVNLEDCDINGPNLLVSGRLT
jgi:hypothetical protein